MILAADRLEAQLAAGLSPLYLISGDEPLLVDEALQQGLEARGHEIKIMDQNSGVHAIAVQDGKLYGGADPRREGLALGD